MSIKDLREREKEKEIEREKERREERTRELRVMEGRSGHGILHLHVSK